MTRLLLKSGADDTVMNKNGLMALHVAAGKTVNDALRIPFVY